MSKIWSVVRVNRDPSDTYAATELFEALELAQPDEGDVVEFGTVKADDAGAARLMKPSSWRRLERRGDDWWTANPAGKVAGGKRQNPSFSIRREFDKLFKANSPDEREELFAAMSYAEEEQSGREAWDVLVGANEMLGWRGVKILHPAAKGYKDREIGYYVDGGSTDRITLLFDLQARRFAIGTADDLEGQWYRESGEYKAPIAYRLKLTPSEWEAVTMMNGRYDVATLLSNAKNEDTGEAEFTESEAWELNEAFETEGAPNFAPRLVDKISNFLDKVV